MVSSIARSGGIAKGRQCASVLSTFIDEASHDSSNDTEIIPDNYCHDVGETRDFERVLVVDKGRIVEDGSPIELIEWPRSRYRDLLEAEDMVRETLWASEDRRRLEIDGGELFEERRTDLA